MKKIFLCSLIIALTLAVTGCDKVSNNYVTLDTSNDLVLKEEINFDELQTLAISKTLFANEEDFLDKYYGEENLEKVKIFGNEYGVSFIFIPKDKNYSVSVWRTELGDDGNLIEKEEIVSKINTPLVVRTSDYEFITHLKVAVYGPSGLEVFKTDITESGMDGHLVFSDYAKNKIKDLTDYVYAD